jgi:hypothetical protein
VEVVQLSPSAAMVTNMASPLCEPEDATATIFGTTTFDLPVRHERMSDKKERKITRKSLCDSKARNQELRRCTNSCPTKHGSISLVESK